MEGSAGDAILTTPALRVAEPKRYRNLSAWITAGEISASPWSVEKGGLWRSFKATSEGDYDLLIRAPANCARINAVAVL